jgi:dTDP-4-dehydrorhamnose 3,5-epimerase
LKVTPFDPARLRSTDRLEVLRTAIPEVVVLKPRRIEDGRGFFTEAWNRTTFAEAGLGFDFVQDNLSWSKAAFTVRGLHYQSPPAHQTKLAYIPRGRALDAVIDARKGSPTWGRHVLVELSADNGLMILSPKGFLHGIATLEPETLVAYKSDHHFSAAHDGSVAWDDPDLAIPWGLDPALVTLSPKDANAPRWRAWESPFSYGANS